MNFLSGFRKPAWQSGNAEKRAAAVANDQDRELLAALPRIAREDESVDVRKQALRRCDDPSLYSHAMRNDADAGIRDFSRQRWLGALIEGKLETFAEAAATGLSTAEIEKIAVSAKQASVRRTVLALVQRPGFLAERVLADADPEIRLALLERIDAVATLERIADKARKNDKNLARRARDRAEALKLASGDSTVQQRRAEDICESLERLIRESIDTQERQMRLSALESNWHALETAALPAVLQARFDGACAVLRVQISPPQPTVVVDSISETDIADIEPAETDTTASAPSPEQIAAEAKLQAQLAANAERLERERANAEATRQARKRIETEQDGKLEALTRALGAGDLANARNLSAALDPAALSPNSRRHWQALQPQLKKLADWEHWANNKVRARLCDEIEQFSASGAHPDALATRIRDAQLEWKRLDALEGRAADAEPTGLDKRFRAVCSRALKPARGYFEKRDALRDERQKRISGFLDQTADTFDSEPAIRDLLELQRAATTHLRDLGELRHGDRRDLAARLRKLLDAVRARLESAFSTIESDKQRLIETATQLAARGDSRGVAAEAKQLMQRWKTIGTGRTAPDQKQWREFRAALDRVFGELDQRREQAQTQAAEHLREAETLVADIEKLAALEGDELAASSSQLRSARERWQVLDIRDRALSDRYDVALTRHRDASRAHDRDRRRTAYLSRIASAPAAAAASSSAALAAAQALVFEVESLAEIEAPAAERDARRQWQLQRLQQHLRGDKSANGGDAIDALLVRWQALGDLDANDRGRFGERIARAIEALIAGS